MLNKVYPREGGDLAGKNMEESSLFRSQACPHAGGDPSKRSQKLC